MVEENQSPPLRQHRGSAVPGHFNKILGSVLLGSAAGLVALSGAQAADLPVKAKPVEYVKICSLYGAGFYYIPGTDTCIRIGGHIRADISFNSRGTATQTWIVGNGNSTLTRNRDVFFTRSRVYTNVDTRTQTALGTLRTFSVVRVQVETPVGTAGSAGAPAVNSAIVQWGGFTIGRAGRSYFDNPWAYATKWGVSGWLGNPDTAGGRFVVAYTHQFGNGVSGTLSLEDNKERKRGNYNGANALSLWGISAPTVDTRGGNTWPEIVGQFRIDRAWGGFHLSANLVNNHVAYNCGAASSGCSELAGHPSDKIGGGVNAALKFDLPTGVRDALYIAGTYSIGATTDAFTNIAPGSAFGIFGGSNIAYGSIVGGYVWDSVYTSTTRTGAGRVIGPTGQQLTTAYGGSVAFEHGWNAEWRTSVFGGAAVLDYNDTANAILCSRHVAGGGAGILSNALTTCDMDYRIIGAGSRTYWSPVRDFVIGVELMWTNHHSGNEGATYTTPTALGFKPDQAYEVRDQNVFSGYFSVRRFF
jgi:hypothetical protein